MYVLFSSILALPGLRAMTFLSSLEKVLQVHLHRTSRSSESDLLQELFIAASSAMLSSSPYLATARLQILPSFTSLSPPRFQTAHYALDLPEIRAHQLIVHVTAVLVSFKALQVHRNDFFKNFF